MRAQIFRKLLLLASAPDGDSMESHVPRKLNTKMPQTANALHSHQISAAQTGVAKSVVSGDARAQQRGGLGRIELFRNGSEAARFSDHRFRISPVHGHSGYHRVLTV